MPTPTGGAGGGGLFIDATLGIDILLGFLATLIATICGVYLGFGKDRQIDEVHSLDKTASLLSSLSQEAENNKDVANSNFHLLRELQAADQDTDHYVLDTFDVDAWEASQHGLIIERTEPELYKEIQSLYSEINNVNEQIRRLRSEALHSTIGDTEELGASELTTWTIEVNYWDRDEGAVDNAGLGDLIQRRCKELKIKCESISNDIDEEVSRLEKKSSEIRSEKVYFPSIDSERQGED